MEAATCLAGCYCKSIKLNLTTGVNLPIKVFMHLFLAGYQQYTENKTSNKLSFMLDTINFVSLFPGFYLAIFPTIPCSFTPCTTLQDPSDTACICTVGALSLSKPFNMINHNNCLRDVVGRCFSKPVEALWYSIITS